MTKTVIRFIGTILTILIFVIIVYGFVNYAFLKNEFTNVIISYGMLAVFILSFLLDLFPQPFSAHNIVLGAGLLGFPMYQVVVITIIAAFLASVLGFWIGKYFEEAFIEDLFGRKKINEMKNRMNKGGGKWYVLLSAISPLPYIPILFGAFEMTWKNFFIYGITPRILGFIVTGLFVHYVLL